MGQGRKICGLERLLKLREEARARGRRVVHAHGCFDIVHPGHIHYLQFARAQGDLLIVSISADPQVNKGAARPLIPEDLRAGSLAALECVDYVYVNPHPTAVELIEQLKPDVYVKGREYERNRDPRFLAEREAVGRHGGRVVFSSGDVIYSSTALIGGMGGLAAFNDEKTRRYLGQYGLTSTALLDLVGRFAGKKIVVVGDYILDRYHFCEASAVASEAPVMNLRQIRSEDYDGGAGVIALHLAGMGASPVLVTGLADDEISAGVEDRLTSSGVDVRAVRSHRQIPLKRRYLADLTKVMKVDEGGTALEVEIDRQVREKIMEAAQGADAVVFADFGYGLLSTTLLEQVLPELRPRVPVMAADVSGMRSNLMAFKGVDLLCPTEREVRESLHEFSSGINAAVWRLLEMTGARQAMITLGKQGLLVFDQHQGRDEGESWERRLRSEYLPALAGHAVDPLGCGDALLAGASLALAAGGSVHAAAYVGSVAAAFEVGQIGNRPITLEALLTGMSCADESETGWRLAS